MESRQRITANGSHIEHRRRDFRYAVRGGNIPFTVQVTDALSQPDTQPLSIVIDLPAPPNITTTSLPNGTVDPAYNQTVQATGGTGALTWSLLRCWLTANRSESH